jgi:Raf kinase inhibitor-like YbhB/YbcL family protein
MSRWRRWGIIIFLLALALAGCSNRSSQPVKNSNATPKEEMKLKISSAAFQDGSQIPSKYTCDGANVSPPLQWSGVPQSAKTIVLICDDPDAPAKTWVHWVVYDLPAGATTLPEALPANEKPAIGGKQGKNDFGKIGYGGPCPPSGTHRYFFKLYAIDTETSLEPSASKDQVLKTIEGHILAQGELIGKYKR